MEIQTEMLATLQAQVSQLESRLARETPRPPRPPVTVVDLTDAMVDVDADLPDQTAGDFSDEESWIGVPRPAIP